MIRLKSSRVFEAQRQRMVGNSFGTQNATCNRIWDTNPLKLPCSTITGTCFTRSEKFLLGWVVWIWFFSVHKAHWHNSRNWWIGCVCSSCRFWRSTTTTKVTGRRFFYCYFFFFLCQRVGGLENVSHDYCWCRCRVASQFCFHNSRSNCVCGGEWMSIRIVTLLSQMQSWSFSLS